MNLLKIESMKTNLPTTQLLGSNIIELHYIRPLFKTMKFINSSFMAYHLLQQVIHPYRIDLKEFFLVILLTNANRILAVSEVAAGTSKGVISNPKEMLQLALLVNASFLIIAHNHPSGTLIPSRSDVRFTTSMKKACRLVDMTLLDHIIFTSESYFSFSDARLL